MSNLQEAGRLEREDDAVRSGEDLFAAVCLKRRSAS